MRKVICAGIVGSVLCMAYIKCMEPDPVKIAETLARSIVFDFNKDKYKNCFSQIGFNSDFENLLRTVNEIPANLLHTGSVSIARYRALVAETALVSLSTFLNREHDNIHDIVAKANLICYSVGGVSPGDRKSLFNKYVIPLLSSCREQYTIELSAEIRNRKIVQCWIDTCLLISQKDPELAKHMWDGLYRRKIVNRSSFRGGF